MRAWGEIKNRNDYGAREYTDLAALYASLLQEDYGDEDYRSIWDRILGLATMALISICGWAVIIDIARLLTR